MLSSAKAQQSEVEELIKVGLTKAASDECLLVYQICRHEAATRSDQETRSYHISLHKSLMAERQTLQITLNVA